ncbi:SAF domain-containing protein [Bifidobacterium biavatii]|nr:SAF domain-containing protein [Bifidobacterium biavatii]
MTDFFVREGASRGRRRPPGASGLRRRRALRAARRWLAALCAGVAVFAALSCMTETAETRRIVVASSDIARGSVIRGPMLQTIDVPTSAALDSAIGSVGELDGDEAVAQVDIAAGQPLFRSMVSARPTVPDGHTVVEVRLSSAPDALTVGEEVSLASASGCTANDSDDHGDVSSDRSSGTEETHEETGKETSNQASDGSETSSATDDAERSDATTATGQSDEPAETKSCTLTSQAVVMAVPQTATGDGGNSDSTFRGIGDAGVVSLAMPSDDAMRVLAAQETGPVIAATRRKH